MAKTITIRFTQPQVEMLIYELEQSVIGDNDSYDRKLKTLIKKIKEERDGGKR